MNARKQPHAAVRGKAHRANILCRRDLVDRNDLRVHTAQHHRDTDCLGAEREHVRVVAKLHLRPALAAHGKLTALVDDRHAQRAVLAVTERQHADEIAQQRRLSAAGRREKKRAHKASVFVKKPRRNVTPEPDVLAHDAKRERRDVLEVIHLSLAHNGTAAYAEAEPTPQRQKSLPQRFNAGIT